MVFADVGVEDGGGEFDGWGVEGDGDLFGEGGELGFGVGWVVVDGLALGVEAVFEEPAGEFGFVVGAGPGVVVEALVFPVADVAAFGFEGVVHELGLAGDDGGVFGAVEEPDGDASDAAGVLGG